MVLDRLSHPEHAACIQEMDTLDACPDIFQKYPCYIVMLNAIRNQKQTIMA